MRPYQSAILDELTQARFADLSGNYDHELGAEPAPPPPFLSVCMGEARKQLGVAARAVSAAWSAALRGVLYNYAPRRYFSTYAAADLGRGAYLYERLEDEKSRQLLLKLVAFRVLGHRKVKLPRNTPEYLPAIETMAEFVTDDPPVKIKFMDLSLKVFDTSPLGYQMRVHATPTGLAYALRQKQYEYHNGDVHVKVEPGDVVIDAGGCWGETSMYFAHEAGPTGRCMVFEFIPSNLEVLRRNLALNPHLAGRLIIAERPVWSSSGNPLFFVDWGPGSRVAGIPSIGGARPDGRTTTTTIDDAMKMAGLTRLDFIKMDIEGAELEALKGAEASIRAHRPKLAISLYHRPEDFTDIPRWIDSLGLGYRFYLEHHTLYQNETVLFCVAPDRVDGSKELRLSEVA